MREGSARALRCAIYTRKSSEEGLEQDFNSLEAQREACEAYIRSQAHEGWVPLPDPFDDGGYSGGNVERPALTRLMDKVRAGEVDVIVIYKIDRLTRSLMDFSRLAEAFEKHNVSFVSVTQQFNTTTSMGRLMLNVLLSFAQFERELTGERIRDKFAASKRRGMWMGGPVPLGYDVQSRGLVINPDEAETVRLVFQRYLELGTVRLLQEDLDRRAIRTKVCVTRAGRTMGGRPFSRGHLYKLLSNPLYIGDVRHKTDRHKGLHEPIIEMAVWDRVQATLSDNTQGERRRGNVKAPHLLAGLLFDADGNRFTVSHAVKDGKRYRYYVGPPLAGGHRGPRRLPAIEIEQAVLNGLQSLLTDERRVVELFAAGRVNNHGYRDLAAKACALREELESAQLTPRHAALDRLVKAVVLSDTHLTLTIDHEAFGVPGTTFLDLDWQTASSQSLLLEAPLSIVGVDYTALVRGIACGRAWFDELATGRSHSFAEIARRAGVDERYVARLVDLAFLAPRVVEDVLAGRPPPHVNLTRLTVDGEVPLVWGAPLRTTRTSRRPTSRE